MTVGELKKILESMEDDLKVAVPFSPGIGSAAVHVKSARAGFDWNHGQLLLVPEETLSIYRWYKELKDMFRDAEDKRAPLWMDAIRDKHPQTGCFTNQERTCEVCKLLKYIDALRVKKAKA